VKRLLPRSQDSSAVRGARSLFSETQAVRVDGTDRTPLFIPSLARNHWIIYRADRTLLPLQLHAAVKSHEPAVGEERVGLVDVEPFEGDGLVELIGKTII